MYPERQVIEADSGYRRQRVASCILLSDDGGVEEDGCTGCVAAKADDVEEREIRE